MTITGLIPSLFGANSINVARNCQESIMPTKPSKLTEK